jgi:hypothetical protein
MHTAPVKVLVQSPVQRGAQKKKNTGVPCNHQLFSRAGLPWRGAGAGASSNPPGRLALTGASSVVATGGSLALSVQPKRNRKIDFMHVLSWKN